MGDPAWGRAGIRPPNAFGPLGDPVRWGATVVQTMPPIILAAPFQGDIIRSGQILSVQCRDPYPRAWTLAGTLSISAEELWLAPDANFASSWAAAAFVTMGVGQTAIAHAFNLRSIVEADSPYYWNSDLSNPFFNSSNAPRARAFIIPGALVGNAVNIQIVQSLHGPFLASLPAVTFTTTLIVTPFDPGAK